MDPCSGPDMDPLKWSNLPEELVANVLARLPLIEFQKLRTLCKSWNELALDREFLRLRGTLSHARAGFALFLTGDEASELVYLDLNDPQKWRTISFSFLPNNAALKFLASSAGLLLLGARDREDTTQLQGDLLVVNPVTKVWRKLPRSTLIRDPFYAALAVDEATGNFVVVVAESELREPANTEVFSSKSGCWKRAPSASKAGRWKRVAATMSTPWFYGSVPVFCKPVFCKGAFYHLTWDPEDMVSAFPVEQGVWRCVKGKGSVPGGVPWGVMELDGKVVLVEMSYPKEGTMEGGNTDAHLYLWELEPEKLAWVKRERIPSPPRKELRIEKWRRFAVGDGFVCATFLLPGTIVTFSNQADSQLGMIYDVAQGSWMDMPNLPGTPWGKISSLFSFQASLSGPSSSSSSSSC